MKYFIVTLLLLVSVILPIRADNWLQNGDFTDGISHWHGDGRSPADFAPNNPFDAPDPLTSKGLIMVPKNSSWIKVAQDFKGRIAKGILSITYLVSPDLAFSEKPDDYVNMPGHIDYNAWAAFNTPPGQWIIFISDFGSARGTYYEVKPDLTNPKPQTYRAPVTGLTPLEDKTITLAFPPGKGKIVILNVSLVDGGDAESQ